MDPATGDMLFGREVVARLGLGQSLWNKNPWNWEVELKNIVATVAEREPDALDNHSWEQSLKGRRPKWLREGGQRCGHANSLDAEGGGVGRCKWTMLDGLDRRLRSLRAEFRDPVRRGDRAPHEERSRLRRAEKRLRHSACRAATVRRAWVGRGAGRMGGTPGFVRGPRDRVCEPDRPMSSRQFGSTARHALWRDRLHNGEATGVAGPPRQGLGGPARRRSGGALSRARGLGRLAPGVAPPQGGTPAQSA